MAFQKNFRQFLGRAVEKYVAAHWTAPYVAFVFNPIFESEDKTTPDTNPKIG